MAEVQRQLGDAVAGFVQSGGFQLALRIVALYIVALWLGAAWSTFRDAQNRSRNPAMAYVAATWVILFSPAFFPFALLIYRLVRPPELLADIEDRRLTQAALLGSATDELDDCPRCGRSIEPNWVACPSCRLLLSRLCPSCGRSASFDWLGCAWCGESLAPAPADPSERRPIELPGVLRPAPVLGGNVLAIEASLPPDLKVEPPPFIAATGPAGRLRPVGQRQRRPATRKAPPAADRQTA